MLEGFKNYLKEARLEIRRVSWPTKKKTLYLTFVVIGISFIFAAYLGLLDFIFISILTKFF